MASDQHQMWLERAHTQGIHFTDCMSTSQLKKEVLDYENRSKQKDDGESRLGSSRYNLIPDPVDIPIRG